MHNPEVQVKELFDAIYETYKYDFRDYSIASMRRRVGQALMSSGYTSVSSLQQAIIKDPKSFTDLLRFLTIPVSEMFRDPTFFQAFREKVVPVLRTYPSLKIWIAGCSTGEEVYSFAIILKEEGLLDKTIIYATDINEASLSKAKEGIYSITDVQKFTVNYQKSGGKEAFSKYYTADFGSAIFNSSLRKNITFTDHSLATDHVFSEMHFISCRNVLIYFQKKLQERSLGLFTDSLCRKGFLGLGPKESLEFSRYAKDYHAISKIDRIFQKINPP